MVLVGHAFAVELHEEPVAASLDDLVLGVSNLVLDKLLARQSLEAGQVVFFENVVDFLPHGRCGRVLFLLLLLATRLPVLLLRCGRLLCGLLLGLFDCDYLSCGLRLWLTLASSCFSLHFFGLFSN